MLQIVAFYFLERSKINLILDDLNFGLTAGDGSTNFFAAGWSFMDRFDFILGFIIRLFLANDIFICIELFFGLAYLFLQFT